MNEAVRHVDRMTERERFRARGLYYYLTADYPSCVKEYGELVARYRSDAAAHNNLALCLTRLRDMPKALDEMREVVAILPNRALYRVNLALYAAYAGDFATAQSEAVRAQQMSPLGHLPLAFAQVGNGRLDEARRTYEAFARVSPLSASFAASGLGDLASYSGRFSEAVRVLEEGAAADRAAANPDRAAAKLAAVASRRARQGPEGRGRRRRRSGPWPRARRRRSGSSPARIFAQAGQPEAARDLAEAAGRRAPGRATGLRQDPRGRARAGRGRPARGHHPARRGQRTARHLDRPLHSRTGVPRGRRLRPGRLRVRPLRCKRRGEALSLFLDEEPTFAFFAPLEYYQGRVREGLGTASYADAYRRYLDLRGAAGEDPVVDEVRRRLASGPHSSVSR